MRFDERRLDDPGALAAGDPGDMLRAIATSAAQVRSAAASTVEVNLGALTAAGRPRAVVVAGMGGSGIAGDVLAAVAGAGSPVPVIVHRSYGLPAWVGPADLVVLVSCSGGTEETLSAAQEALRRGVRLMGVGAPGSPLADVVARARGAHVPVQTGLMPRASMWALSMPPLLLADALGVLSVPPSAVEAAAVRLEQTAVSCRPEHETFVNPAKTLAGQLAGRLPLVWGASPVAGVAAARTAGQLAENAKYPSIPGVLPEANHNQVVALDGPYAALAEADTPALRLLVLRDTVEHPQVARRADASVRLAEARGADPVQLWAQGAGPLERLASLVGLIDYASVYLGLGLGVDPTPITAIAELKTAIAD